MAEVFRAVTHGPAGFQRQFVIKRIRKEKAASKDFVDMFINEARISALLEHPNIVQVYDFGQVEGDYFLAMEYLRGRNLLTVGRRVRSLTREIAPELAAYVARETARGLHYAHTLTNAGKSLGIVHRDVSPSNIMLLRTGGVKLLDFGIARATMKLRANTPIGGLIKGKLSYLSPEQVRGQKVDGRSDVFSLGVVLWECLTGVRLFYNPNDLETMRNVLHRQVPRPSEMRHGLAESLDNIVMKALERDADKRYSDAGAMAADIEEYLREVRFSSETLVQLLEELFADEDSARELPLPGDGSSSAIEIKISTGGRPASSGDSLQPPPGSGADDAENGYATVSSIHRLSEVAARHRRRRLLTASAGGAVLLAGMVFAALRIPGRDIGLFQPASTSAPVAAHAPAAPPPPPAPEAKAAPEVKAPGGRPGRPPAEVPAGGGARAGSKPPGRQRGRGQHGRRSGERPQGVRPRHASAEQRRIHACGAGAGERLPGQSS